jgi:hypothetical protein
LECLRSRRILLVYDNLESVLEEGEDSGRMRAGYEGFSRVLLWLAILREPVNLQELLAVLGAPGNSPIPQGESRWPSARQLRGQWRYHHLGSREWRASAHSAA